MGRLISKVSFANLKMRDGKHKVLLIVKELRHFQIM
jgi:hypothetical protein